MFDYKKLAKDPVGFHLALERRGNLGDPQILVENIQEKLAQRNRLTALLQDLQKSRNLNAAEVSALHREGKEVPQQKIADGREIKALVDSTTHELTLADEMLEEIVAAYPNILDESVPQGPDKTSLTCSICNIALLISI